MKKGLSVLIMGRPNVGKSTLFNRLLGKRVALTADQPGVTRDWQVYECTWEGLFLRLYDFPGLETISTQPWMSQLWTRALSLIERCDVILLLFDAKAGITSDDEALALWLRQQNTSVDVYVVANKAEGLSESSLFEGCSLGYGLPIPVSALHGQGMKDLHRALAARPLQDILPLPFQRENPLIAVMGRPNVGKSTFINACLQEQRLLAGPQAGLTRDCVSVTMHWKGKDVCFIDTAGLRKQSHVQEDLEKDARHESYHALMFCQVCLLLLDATRGLEKQDLTILSAIEEEGRGLVIGLNKWDKIKDGKAEYASLQRCIEENCAGYRGVPLIPMSAETGYGMGALARALFTVQERWQRRLSTSVLNRWLREALAAHQPPLVKGKRIRLKYMCQAKARPPTFVIFGNQIEALETSYRRYLINGLVETFQLQGSGLRLIFRSTENPYSEN